MVDCTGLENRQTERFPGFESLGFRQKMKSPASRGIFFVEIIRIFWDTMPIMKQLEKTDEYQSWVTSLKDRMVVARIQARIDRLVLGNAGDVAPVGESVSELRLHFGAGWRVYFTERNGAVIILLAGGNKSTQAKDIQLAIKLAQNL